MKPRITIALLGCLAVIGVMLLFTRPTPAAPQSVRFAGFTNGVVGPIAPVYATLNTNTAANFQRWLTAGTNAAVFTITNEQTCAIWLYPFARICTEDDKPTPEMALLNAPSFSGIRLSPGEVADIQVAMLPHHGPWRLQLSYHRDSCGDSFLKHFKRLPEEFRARAMGRPVQVQMHTIDSELVYP
jgi:hypothetical protein